MLIEISSLFPMYISGELMQVRIGRLWRVLSSCLLGCESFKNLYMGKHEAFHFFFHVPDSVQSLQCVRPRKTKGWDCGLQDVVKLTLWAIKLHFTSIILQPLLTHWRLICVHFYSGATSHVFLWRCLQPSFIVIGALTTWAQDQCDGHFEHAGAGKESWCEVLVDEYKWGLWRPTGASSEGDILGER